MAQYDACHVTQEVWDPCSVNRFNVHIRLAPLTFFPYGFAQGLNKWSIYVVLRHKIIPVVFMLIGKSGKLA